MPPDIEKRKAALSAEQRAELERRLQGNRRRTGVDIQRVSRSSPLPLSYAQERIWLHEQLVPGSLVHNRPTHIRVRGPLNVAALRQALQQVVRQHEALRTNVCIDNGQARQRIDEEFTPELLLSDVSGDSDAEGRAKQLAMEESRQPFDLQKGPLLHARLVRIANDDHLFLLTFHHFTFDAWSQAVLTRELAANYQDFASGQKPGRDELPIQYADYTVWERDSIHKSRMDDGRSFWKEELADPPVLQLPTDFPRPQNPDEVAGQVAIHIRPQVASALRDLTREEHATVFAALLATFTVLLHRYSQQDDIIVGCPVAGRTRVETEDLIGVFINLLPFRAKLDHASSFRQLLRQIRDTTIDALKHQHVPFQRIVQDVLTNRDTSLHPLFQTLFIYESFPLGPRTAADVTFRPELVGSVAMLVDLSLELMESQRGIAGYFCFRRDLWEAASIERLAGHFLTLLEGLVANPDCPIAELPLLTQRERQQLLVEWNDTTADYPRDKCVHELFEAQVKRTPDAVAVVSGDQQLTYREVNERANRLAHYLRSIGVGPDVLVGLCLKRSFDLVVSILGILKAGGAYVPLDANYPRQRLVFMLQDAAIRILITDSDLIDHLPCELPEVVCLDSANATLATRDSDNPGRRGHPENVAYVIYTSGSTGKPKGVVVEHRSIVNVLTSVGNLLGLRFGQPLLGFASPTFDISVAEIFLPLSVGGIAIMTDRDVVFECGRMVHEIRKQRPRIIQATPATWEMLADYDGWGSEELTLISTGEALPKSVARRLRAKCGSLWDLYGPTEATIWSTAHRVTTPSNSIGRPIDNVQAFVLDGQQKLTPVGVWGELYIGGDGLARGYLNRPELTAERFIANPFSADPNSRLYRTGDRVRWRADGDLEFHGRLDDQVKLRGFRIELGEVESALREHSGVAQCAVVLREDRPEDKRLVAYWVPRRGVPDLGLREYLLNRLPDYMIPSAFVRLESLPLSPSGKLDRQSLPAPDRWRLDFEVGYAAPRNVVEESLADIWSEVLGIERVGIHDNFFELGGHSLLATQAVSRACSVLMVDIRLRKLFEAPTIAELAAHVAVLRAGGADIPHTPLSRIDRQSLERLPPSFAQERMWFLEQLEGKFAAYNVPYAIRLRGPLDVESLRKALETIVHRHEPLRTTFEMPDGELAQIIQPPARFELPLVDFSDLGAEAQEAKIARRSREEAEWPFDLANDLMLRATLLRRAENEHVLLLVMHHIAWDGWSQQVLWRELAALYDAYCRNESPSLPELPIQYLDYAVWQRNELQGDRLDGFVKYWRKQLDGLIALELPTDHPRPPCFSYRGASHNFDLPGELVLRLQGLSRTERVTLHMALLAAFQVLLGRYSGQDDIAVGTPIAGRTHAKLEAPIGLFVNILVLRTDLSGEPTFRELLNRVRETSLGAYDHQDLPFEKLVEELQPERHINRNPLFQAMFQLLSFSGDGPNLSGLEVSRLSNPSQRARFDLEMHLWTQTDGVRGVVVYSSELFDAATIQRMGEDFLTLLEGIATDPDRPIGELPLLADGERGQLRPVSLPLIAGGERDCNALIASARQSRQQLAQGYAAPQTATERILAEVWQTALGVDRVGIHDDFFELGGHSILAARVCVEIEKRLRRRVPLTSIFGAPNIQLLAKTIANEQSSQGGVVIVPLQPLGRRPPLFIMPSISGLPWSWKELLGGLDAERPVFAIGTASEDALWNERATLPEIASHFVVALRYAKVDGPLHILGYSFGGMLAYEVARQLHDAGIAVGRVLIVDTGPEQLRGNSWWTSLRNLPRFLANAPPWIVQFAFRTTPSQQIYDLRRKFRSWGHHVKAAITRQPAIKRLEGAIDTRNVPEEFRKRMETNYNAFKSYIPGAYTGRLVLFRAKMRPLLHGFTPDLNWGQVVTGGVEVIEIAGNHGSIFQQPNIDLLAVRLQDVLGED